MSFATSLQLMVYRAHAKVTFNISTCVFDLLFSLYGSNFLVSHRYFQFKWWYIE